ncbi:PREDICTED: ATP-dependent DNA helicase PIF1-like [Camelina sativa]|uniref:ATP-dependent DNA helicase n=1 Tax=Camelina sativa TaxID=90675 RepID=A0ABM0USE5_CAMSA|nr:PREDICTED: ATP-dependent DNA helicase PIF1-like [Camelina sativa]
MDELNYNREDLAKKHVGWKKMLTEEQKKIYDEIMEAVTNDKASSGIASLLLEGGRTAHSRFALPLNPNETSTCNMSQSSELGALVKEAKLIIWDEAPMMSKYCFETLDRSLKDIMRYKEDKLFGGKFVLFGGDFRQILPVIFGAGRQAIVNASLNSSYLWNQCKVLRLTKNMRLLQDIGKQEANIPQELLIPDSSPLESIIEAVYGKNFATQKDPKFFQQRAILCPTNEDINSINDVMLSSLNAEERIYLSSDSIDPQDKRALKNKVYSPDFLNTIKVSGIPYHRLRLKIGCPIMLMRNIDPHGGLMNGTRLKITQMADHVLQARILTGTRVGKIVLIPRMLISPSDARLPFKMRRRQFPVSVAFAMTINKSQGQSLENVGIYLSRPVFSHGQLYVAMSRVKSKFGLKMLITDSEGKPQTKTTNVVFKEVFQNLH